MPNHILKIKPYSEGENYFVNELMLICKDKAVVRLGEIWGFEWNEYEISHNDYMMIKEYIQKKRRIRLNQSLFFFFRVFYIIFYERRSYL